MEALFLEKHNVKVTTVPVDLNDAANTGARVKMDQGERLTFLVPMGASTAATVQFQLKQHNAASSGTTKALNMKNPYFVKAAPATVHTKVDAPGTDTLDLSTTFAAAAGLVAIEVLQEDLDVNNGFAWVSLSMSDAGAAKLGAILAIVHQGRIKPLYDQAI